MPVAAAVAGVVELMDLVVASSQQWQRRQQEWWNYVTVPVLLIARLRESRHTDPRTSYYYTEFAKLQERRAP